MESRYHIVWVTLQTKGDRKECLGGVFQMKERGRRDQPSGDRGGTAAQAAPQRYGVF